MKNCRKCRAILPVPCWKTCQACDKSKKPKTQYTQAKEYLQRLHEMTSLYPEKMLRNAAKTFKLELKDKTKLERWLQNQNNLT